MRPLFRLFLFTTVRVSLLLAIILWVATQYWEVKATGDFIAWPFEIVISQAGAAVVWTNTGTNFWEFEVLSLIEGGFTSWAFDPSEIDLRTYTCLRPFPGVVYLATPAKWILSAQHWLITSLCVFSYALLKLVYRRNSNEED